MTLWRQLGVVPHSLVTQAANAEVRLLGQEEDAAFALVGAFKQPRPSRPQLADDAGD